MFQADFRQAFLRPLIQELFKGNSALFTCKTLFSSGAITPVVGFAFYTAI